MAPAETQLFAPRNAAGGGALGGGASAMLALKQLPHSTASAVCSSARAAPPLFALSFSNTRSAWWRPTARIRSVHTREWISSCGATLSCQLVVYLQRPAPVCCAGWERSHAASARVQHVSQARTRARTAGPHGPAARVVVMAVWPSCRRVFPACALSTWWAVTARRACRRQRPCALLARAACTLPAPHAEGGARTAPPQSKLGRSPSFPLLPVLTMGLRRACASLSTTHPCYPSCRSWRRL